MRPLRCLFLLAALAAVAGCSGDKRVPVSGKVTVGGKGPLTGGNIRFVSVADPNRVGGGMIKADGSYEVPDAPVGECKVVIDNTHLDPAPKSTGGMPMAPGAGAPLPGPGGMPGKGPPKTTGPTGLSEKDKANIKAMPKGIDIPGEMNAGKADHAGDKYVKIDPAYTKPESTTLKATVQSGSNSFDFDVK